MICDRPVIQQMDDLKLINTKTTINKSCLTWNTVKVRAPDKPAAQKTGDIDGRQANQVVHHDEHF